MSEFLFFTGLSELTHARHFERSFISVNTLKRRKSDFPVKAWIMDSGAFTEISTHGHYRASEEVYAGQIDRWRRVGDFKAAAIQDYMCEPFILAKTGLSVADHQRMTIERFDRLRELTDAPLLPVIQGYEPEDYVSHIEQYGNRLPNAQWVGVGSVCKRNTKPVVIEKILGLIKKKRSDLKLHGFGLKITALRSADVRINLFSSDSMAWSFNARMNGRDSHDWREAMAYTEKVNALFTRNYDYDPNRIRDIIRAAIAQQQLANN